MVSARVATLGIDVGGTRIKLGLLTQNELLFARTFATKSHRPRDAILHDIGEGVAEIVAEARLQNITVAALGLGVPATIDTKFGQTLLMPNFAEGWFEFSVVDYFEQTTGLATSLINDARAFVLAESTLGAARDFDNVFGIILGTGVGGGVVLSGQLYTGSGALAGEIGHHIVDPHGVSCGCGSVGCLETVASAPALVGSVTRAFLHGRSPVLYDLSGGDTNAISASLVAQAAKAGDVACQEAITRVARFLGVALANVTTLLAPECIVIGGGLSGASDLIFPVIYETWKRHLCVAGRHLPKLLVAQLTQPGVIGAAVYARNRMEEA